MYSIIHQIKNSLNLGMPAHTAISDNFFLYISDMAVCAGIPRLSVFFYLIIMYKFMKKCGFTGLVISVI